MPSGLLNSVGIVLIGDRLNCFVFNERGKDGINFTLSQLSTKTEISFKKVYLKA